jgi:hypothetical protein
MGKAGKEALIELTRADEPREAGGSALPAHLGRQGGDLEHAHLEQAHLEQAHLEQDLLCRSPLETGRVENHRLSSECIRAQLSR